jgi:hypothetical protein
VKELLRFHVLQYDGKKLSTKTLQVKGYLQEDVPLQA